jgi:hypothetical protein
MQTLHPSPKIFFIFPTSFPYVKNDPKNELNLFFIFPTSLNYVKNEPKCLFYPSDVFRLKHALNPICHEVPPLSAGFCFCQFCDVADVAMIHKMI